MVPRAKEVDAKRMLILSRPDVIDMDATNLQYGSTMQVRVVRQDGQPVVLLLEGELDITSMDSFERALAHVRPERETGITFDLRECTYMSVQGYEAMVRVSRQTRGRGARDDRPRVQGPRLVRLRRRGADDDPRIRPPGWALSAFPTSDGGDCGPHTTPATPGVVATRCGNPRPAGSRTDDGEESAVRIWLELRAIAAGAGSTLPKPGSGGTGSRLATLADWAARDLSLARLLEGHVDALAILNEAGREPESGAIYGVWAARPPGGGTTARLAPDGWHLTGTKPFCSGSTRLDRALVTAECGDGYRLFDISVAENVVRVHPGSWPAVGMADSLSDTLDFGGAPVPADRAVGPPGFYLERPGFWFGATGVAACWYGGARGLVGHVLQSLGPHPSELMVTEVGYAVAHIDLMRRALQQAAGEIDADPTDDSGEARRHARSWSVTRCITPPRRSWCTPPRPEGLDPSASMPTRPGGWRISTCTWLSTAVHRTPMPSALSPLTAGHGLSRRRRAPRH